MIAFADLSSDEQFRVHDKVYSLHAVGLGYKRIINRILAEDNIQLYKSLLSHWFIANPKLIGGKNSFTPEPSPELAYVIGVLFGDGSLNKNSKRYDYKICLSTIDKEFAQEFSRCLVALLNKSKLYPAHKEKRSNSVVIHVRSKRLYEFLKSLKTDFEKVKPFADAFSAEFIRGVADSEGFVAISAANKFSVAVGMASANLLLLEYILRLLKEKFDIDSSIRLVGKKGETDSMINGRPITRTMSCYSLMIVKKNSVKKFSANISFNIIRKKQKLIDALQLMENFSRADAINEWKLQYTKGKKEWVKKSPTIFTPTAGIGPTSQP